jgi:hypothetical protein
VEKLKEVKIFKKFWIDKHDMKGDMVDEITKGIRESQVVFILLSDWYVNSDCCRSEWTFARGEENVQIYLIIAQEFDRKKYDWVRFYIGSRHFYRIDRSESLELLIVNLGGQLEIRPSHEKIEDTKNSNASKNISTGKKEYLKKRLINEWTPFDIREWCLDNNLGKWSELLKDYDGAVLLELHRTLSIEAHLQHFMTIKDMNIIDVTLLKSKLDRLILPTTVTKKEDIKKRRTSKSSTK